MASEKKWLGLTLVNAVDLSNTTPGTGPLYKAIQAAATANIASVGSGSIGLLQSGQNSGGHSTVGWHGEMKFVAAGAVSAGTKLAVTTSGYLQNPNSGDYVVGYVAEEAVSSGEIGRGIFDFGAKYQYRPDSFNLDGAFAFATANDLSAATTNGLAFQANSGDYPAAAGTPTGVVATGAASGGNAVVIVAGITEFRAGNVVGAGRLIRHAASGWWINADSGDKASARAIDGSAAGNSGGLFTGYFMPVPHYITSCLDMVAI